MFFKYILCVKYADTVEITRGFNQGYVLQINSNPSDVLIVGNSTAGTFYGAVSLIWLLNNSGSNIILPNVKIDDWPDLKVRGFYGWNLPALGFPDFSIESGESLIDNLTMLKYNLI